MEVDAVVDVVAAAEVVNDKSKLTNPKPHDPLFVDFKGCPLPTCHGPLAVVGDRFILQTT